MLVLVSVLAFFGGVRLRTARSCTAVGGGKGTHSAWRASSCVSRDGRYRYLYWRGDENTAAWYESGLFSRLAVQTPGTTGFTGENTRGQYQNIHPYLQPPEGHQAQTRSPMPAGVERPFLRLLLYKSRQTTLAENFYCCRDASKPLKFSTHTSTTRTTENEVGTVPNTDPQEISTCATARGTAIGCIDTMHDDAIFQGGLHEPTLARIREAPCRRSSSEICDGSSIYESTAL